MIQKVALFGQTYYEDTKDYLVDPFKDDNRHMKDEYVSFIMKIFEQNYCL